MRRTSTFLVTLAAAGLVLGSCGKVAEKASEEIIENQAGGGEVDIDDDGSVSFENDEGSFSVDGEGNLDIESEDGSYNVDSSGEMPDDFPDVPLPDDYAVQSSTTQSDNEATYHSVNGYVDDDDAQVVFEDLVDAYEDDDFETQGKYENTTDGEFGGGATFESSEWTVNVSVISTSNDDEGTLVSLTVGPSQE